jgi:uncharacterized protein (DUF302 family)
LVPLFAAGPSSATSERGKDKTEAEFTITGFRCDLEVTRERTLRNGKTLIRSTQTGVTESSIALMAGALTVTTTAILNEDGSGKTFGRWTLTPEASTGSIKGWLRGEVSEGDQTEIASIGWGRGALRGATVKMVTRTPGPAADGQCGDESSPASLTFEGEGTATARTPDSPVGAVVIDSTKDFSTTVNDLAQAITANPNLTLIKTVDHQAAAAGRDLTLAPTTELFFGNPRIGTPLMQAEQQTGIDLPQKMLIWEDLLGTVRVGYNAPGYLQSRHGIDGADEQLQTVANALAALAGVATGTTVEPVFDAGTVRKDRGLVTVTSTKTTEEAFDAIVAALTAAPPVNVAFELEHDQNAANVDLELRPTKLVVFGNPSLGTGLMQTNQSVALDLPQKILVYENASGETVIAYNDPTYVVKRHGVRNQDDVVETLSGALANFANVGA